MKKRGVIISHYSNRKKERSLKNVLLEEICKLESKEEINLPLIEEKGLLLKDIRKRKMEGLIIKSRAKCVEKEEKPTTYMYFCN